MSVSDELEQFCRDLDKRHAEVEAERWKKERRRKKRKKEFPLDIKHSK